MQALPLDKLTYIVVKAREFGAMVPPEYLEGGSNAADDKEVGILESTRDNPTQEELTGVLEALNEDELTELMALIWLGRGDYEASEWPRALQEARERTDRRTVRYLLGTAMLADLLEEGASM
ncbi:MAG: DUF3775 domain-containing protein, partial [Pseudomonadota bacterium]|nr:DUF3775 domain-containing protein [Pseudomonadota bacterium]